MIYFDNNKQVYAFEISNPIATIDSDTWLKYAGTDKWDIIAGQFLDITDTPEYQQKEAQKAKDAHNQEIFRLLDENRDKYVRSLLMPVDYVDEAKTVTYTDFYKSEDERLRLQLI